MTIFLVLGLIAGLYMIWLLFHLAIHALPVSAGIGGGLWLHSQGYGYLASILGGLLAGTLVVLIGQLLLAHVRSPILRLAIMLTFAVPAAVAGYHAIYSIAGLALAPGASLSILAWGGALTIGAMAFSRSGGPAPSRIDSSTEMVR